MPYAARRLDLTVGSGSHGKKCCPHSLSGVHMMTRKNVTGNSRGMVTRGDIGIHNCPHCPYFMAIGNRHYVKHNNRPAHHELAMFTDFCGVSYTICTGPKNITMA